MHPFFCVQYAQTEDILSIKMITINSNANVNHKQTIVDKQKFLHLLLNLANYEFF